MTIRPAKLYEGADLHAPNGRSALRSGYEPEFLDWEPEAIAVTPDFLAHSMGCVLKEIGRLIGQYSLVGGPPVISLERLLTAPEWIGTSHENASRKMPS